jgi:hypothetical protein
MNKFFKRKVNQLFKLSIEFFQANFLGMYKQEQKLLKTKKLLNFIHIPKTAGATFGSILKRNFRDKHTFAISGLYPLKSIDELKKVDVKRKNKICLLMGHWSLKCEHLFENRDIVRIVFLRDPVRHFISEYYYIQTAAANKLHKVANELSLEEFITYMKELNLDNLQVRHLSDVYVHMEKNEISINDDSYLEKAKQTLDSIHYVFLTEKFDEALEVLKKEGVLENVKYKRLNASQSQGVTVGELEKKIIEKIELHNAEDMKLYNYAKQKNEELIRKMSDSEKATCLT